jgi:hypothetical protein
MKALLFRFLAGVSFAALDGVREFFQNDFASLVANADVSIILGVVGGFIVTALGKFIQSRRP